MQLLACNDANQPVTRRFDSGNHIFSDMKTRSISGSTDRYKRQEMRLISKLGIVHSYGINERFPYVSLPVKSRY